jgi:hypothetical protein
MGHDKPSRRQHKADSKQPQLFITTSIPISGTPVVGNDGVIHVFAKGFKFYSRRDNYVTVMIDGRVIDETAKVMEDNSIKLQVKIPEGLSNGDHTVKVVQKLDNEEIVANSTFVKAAIDNFG